MFKKTATGESTLDWPIQKGEKRVYSIGRVLGKGGFGKCYELIDRANGSKFACKIIDKHSQQYKLTQEKVKSQMELHKRMDHPNIVRFEQYHQDERYIYFLLELCSNKTLDEVMQRRKQLSQVEVRYYFHQILKGVKYIHDQKVVHRDLKLENFFISEQMTVKIGDFGLATALSVQKRRKSVCGTPHYMAPQIYANKEGYSFEIDLWSLGIIAFLLLAGRFPFESNEPSCVAASIKNKTYLNRTNLSENAQSFITKLLQLAPNERMGIKQLLKHDFFVMYDIPETIPLPCLVCEPTFSFIKKYRSKKVHTKIEENDEDFHFMLESKESPSNADSKPELNYKQIDSVVRSEEQTRERCDSLAYEKGQESCLIKKWVAQYWEYPRNGLMYRMSDGLVGIRFNDGSNLKITDHLKEKCTYIPTTGKRTTIKIKDYKSIPQQLMIKANIFRKLLQTIQTQQCSEYGEALYVRLYCHTITVFVLWLSDGTLQAKYPDSSQLVLSAASCMYISDKKTKTVFHARNICLQSQEILEKKRIVEDVIHRISKIKKEVSMNNKENVNPSELVSMLSGKKAI